MICHSCHGSGQRLNPRLMLFPAPNGFRVDNPQGLPLLVPCEECIGGVAIWCDTAGLAQPVAQRFFIRRFGGSNPPPGTISPF